MLTVLTWLWRQPVSRYKYTAHDVNLWAAMVSRNLSLPHRLCCVTDQPDGIDSSVEIIPLPDVFADLRSEVWDRRHRDGPQCWRRLHMWHPEAERWYGKRFVCMDLDCVITDSLDPVFDRPEDLVLYRGTSGRRPYNGSMLLMTAGCRDIYHRINQKLVTDATKVFVGSDQAVFSYLLGQGEATWGPDDGVYWYKRSLFPVPRKLSDAELRRHIRAFGPIKEKPDHPANMRIVFFPGSVKPSQARDRHAFIREHYRM